MIVAFTLKRYIKIAVAVAVAAIAVAAIIVSLTSCGIFEPEDIHTRIHQKYSDIRSFSAMVEITVNTDRTTNTYQTRQYFVAPDMFREDVLAPENLAGMTYIFANGTMLIIPPGENESILFEDIPENRNYMFLPDFFARYFAQEAVATPINTEVTESDEVASTDEDFTVLEVTIDAGSRYRASQKLWICNETLLPVTLETYDQNGNPLITVTFTEFKLNARIDNTIFNIQR